MLKSIFERNALYPGLRPKRLQCLGGLGTNRRIYSDPAQCHVSIIIGVLVIVEKNAEQFDAVSEIALVVRLPEANDTRRREIAVLGTKPCDEITHQAGHEAFIKQIRSQNRLEVVGYTPDSLDGSAALLPYG